MSSGDPPIITIIGSLNIDLITYTSRIPEGGETLSANSFLTGSGGKGGNQAAACAKLSRTGDDLKDGSARIRMVGAVGDDLYGQRLLDDLCASGVDITSIATVEKETGVAIILVEESTGQNRILIHAGANETLTPAAFTSLPCPQPALLILQLEIPVETTLEILKTARSAGIEVLLNPAPATELPGDAYRDLAHLVLNETEAAILSGRSASELEDDTLLPRVAEDFHDRGVNHVVITLGGRGVYYSSSLAGECKRGLIPAKRVKVVDTTAAGDTFVGAYALAIVQPDFDIEAAVRHANDVAAMTVGRKGAQQSIPWRDELL